MIPKCMRFQKFKDPAVKKPIKRLEQNKNKTNNYVQKLANSLKRRALGSVKKSPPKVTKRKLNFQNSNKQRTPDLPKPMLYGNNKNLQRALLNSTVEEGEIIEEIESSDDDDCIVVEPAVHRIEIKDEDEDVVRGSAEGSNDDVPTSSSFIIDKKRDPQLAWQKSKPNARKGFFYVKKSAVIIDSITIDDSLEQSSRTDSPIKTVEDRKPIADEQKPASNDESVIFVSEDFIPLPADEEEPKTKRVNESKAEATPKRVRQRMNDSLFTTTERKTLAAYNTNTYNPGTTEDKVSVTHKRPIIIDGSNVAFGHGCSNTFSAEGIKYCVEYFEKMGHDVKAVIPLFRRNPNKSSNPALLDQLYKDKKLVFTPCKNLPNQQSISYDDRFILQIAYERNAAVVSNDNYRDLIHENPAFKKIIENRVIGYSWCDNILILPKDPYGRFGPPLSEILRC